MGGATFYMAQVNVQEVWMGRQSTGRLGDCKHLLGSRWENGRMAGTEGTSLMDAARWLAAHGFGHRTDSRTTLRRKGTVHTLGFQKVKKRAFSPSLKASQKEYIPSNESLDGSTASGPEVQQESSSSWWPGPSPTHVNTGQVKAIPSVLQVRFPELPHSRLHGEVKLLFAR